MPNDCHYCGKQPTNDLDDNAAWSDSHFDSFKALDVTVERKI